MVGYGKEKVRVDFDGCWLEPRVFTVNVKPNERRGVKHDSQFFLRCLQETVKDINESLVEIQDLTSAFGELKINPNDHELLLALVKKVNDASIALREDKNMDYLHRLHQFQRVMREETLRLKDPDIMSDLNE